MSLRSHTGHPSHATACSSVPTREKKLDQKGSALRKKTQAASYLAPFSLSVALALTMGSRAS